MKTRKNIYYTIGAILVGMNLLVDLFEMRQLLADIETSGFAYAIGYHILMIFGFVFLRMGYKLNKKIKLNEDFDVEKSIESIGKQ
jgi:hypothetical protein